MVAPTGRALFFQDEAASSAVELDVEAGRCGTNSSANPSIESIQPYSSPFSTVMKLYEQAGAAGGSGMIRDRGAYRSCFAGSIAGDGASSARRAQR
jgi:hypothetical protein